MYSVCVKAIYSNYSNAFRCWIEILKFLYNIVYSDLHFYTILFYFRKENVFILNENHWSFLRCVCVCVIHSSIYLYFYFQWWWWWSESSQTDARNAKTNSTFSAFGFSFVFPLGFFRERKCMRYPGRNVFFQEKWEIFFFRFNIPMQITKTNLL